MIAIEPARVEEVDLIKQVLSETWIDNYAAQLSHSTIEQVTTQWHDPLVLRSQIEDPRFYFAVARDAGTIMGLVTAITLNQTELHISRLYVRPAHQRRGVGGQLLRAAIASHPEAAVIRLEVEQHNARGQAFWCSQGFVAVGTKTEHIGVDEIPVVSMERRSKHAPRNDGKRLDENSPASPES